jgi:AcrR family transcriptional regulator
VTDHDARDTIETDTQPKRAWRGAVADRSERFELKRQVVLRTAARIFSRYGFHQTTLVNIANALHIAKPTLYHYFKNKDEILLEIQQMAISQITDVAQDAMPGDASGRKQLETFVRRYVDMIIDDFGTCLIMIGATPLQPQNRTVVRKGSKQIEKTMRQILATGAADKSLPPCDPKIAAMFLFGSLNWIPYWYRRDGALDPDGLKDRAVEFVLARLNAKEA